MDLSQWCVQGTDEAVFYIPEFVTENEEAYLIQKILATPQQKWKYLTNRRLQIWGGDMTQNNVLIRKDMPSWLDKYPDIVSRLRDTGAYKSSAHGAPNHVILNEYLPGQGIMPHQDGSAYHPVVGTISLGSHAVFHYYRYQSSTGSMDSGSASDVSSDYGGRSIDPDPVLSLLLEPRSLIITTSAWYSSHLHGIEAVEEDVFPQVEDADGSRAIFRYSISNRNLLTGEKALEIIHEGGCLKRGTRYSLTCRDVEKVTSARLLGK